ncbi:hypothetical protein DH2020_021188 [Rehmannia glutinosa]|uniref:R2R3-MYB protein n=1 Tax=Rehmannia glutinosa TaxID=99300 RepID=A0ABR0W9P0_REHGL
MGRAPCCDKANVKKGPWSPEEDAKLKDFIQKFGTGGNWIALPQKAGLKRCGKSCRLRWLNYLRPNIKHGEFSDEEDRIICTLYASIGSRWSIIAAQLPGRTDNDIKNYWNTKLKKKLMAFNNIIPSSNQGKLISQPQYSQPDNYTNSFYNFQAAASKSLTPIDSISAPQNYLSPNSENFKFSLSTTQYSYNYQQSQDQGFVDNLQYCYYPGKLDNNNMLIFGGNDQASCSSSDGSCSKDHVIKQEDQMGYFQGFSANAFADQKPNYGILENNNSQLECDLEEVKGLISSGIGNYNSLLFTDENKTDERGMYYYY